MSDEFEEYDDHIDETIKLSELVCKHKDKKSFKEWMQIAYGLDTLLDKAAGQASLDREENQDYAKDCEFQKRFDFLKKDYPSLSSLPLETRRQLAWLVKYGAQLSRWHTQLSAESQVQLISPAAIRSKYEEDRAKFTETECLNKSPDQV